MKSNFARMKAVEAAQQAEKYFLGCAAISRCVVAGSVRRGVAIVGDLDLVVGTEQPEKACRYFLAWPAIVQPLCSGISKASVMIDGGLQVDVRFVGPKQFGAMLAHCTGPMEHNIAMRMRAKTHGLKLNEYGVFRGEEIISGPDEESIYRALGVEWIEPAQRGKCAHPTYGAGR